MDMECIYESKWEKSHQINQFNNFRKEEERNMSVVAYLYATRTDPLEKKMTYVSEDRDLKQYSLIFDKGCNLVHKLRCWS